MSRSHHNGCACRDFEIASAEHELAGPVHLCCFAAAELQLACKKMRLDPSTPILIFADHGFRIGTDGRSYTHGGPSTLERVVPLLLLSSG